MPNPSLEKAAQILKNGGVVCFPTETVYGIGVIYENLASFERVVSIKRRPPEKPFSMMFSSLEQAFGFMAPSKKAPLMLSRFLPGEVTFLVKAKDGLPHQVTLGTGVMGVRVPSDPDTIEILSLVGKPCLVSSANRSGERTLTDYEEVKELFENEVDYIVNGKCSSLIPTTIVDVTDDNQIKLIRKGAIPFEEIEKYWRTL